MPLSQRPDPEELARLPAELRGFAARAAGLDRGLYDLLTRSAYMHELTRTRLLELEGRSWLRRLLAR